jgi:hypothetical protein
VISENLDEDDEGAEQAVGWQMDTPFDGVNSTLLFEQKLQSRSATRNNNNEEVTPGLQCSPNTVNSPMKA